MSFDKGLTGEWLESAEENLNIARAVVESEEGFSPAVVSYLAQQAAEKSLKALLVAYRLETPRSHNIAELLKLCGDLLESPEELSGAVELTEYAVEARYPPHAAKVTKEEAERAVKQAEKVVDAVRHHLEESDKLPD